MSTPSGEQVAAQRTAKKMSQADLADVTGLSLSYIRKVEQGKRQLSDDARETIARGLNISADRLLDPGTTDSRVHAAIPAIRSVIATYDAPEDGRVRSLSDLRADVRRATQHRIASRYAELVNYLPDLISELSRAFLASHGGEREELAELLTSAYRCADAVAYKYGYFDLSGNIIHLMRLASAESSDPLLHATVAYVRTETFFATKNYQAGLRILEEAIDRGQALQGGESSAVLGSLHMRAGVIAGRGHNADHAYMHMAEADRIARKVRERVYLGTVFGPASVRIHDASLAVELGDGQRAVTAASEWKPPNALPAERRSHYYIDLAHAHLMCDQTRAAFEALRTARTIAPQHVREHPRVRAALRTLLLRHRSAPEALTRFAAWAKAI